MVFYALNNYKRTLNENYNEKNDVIVEEKMKKVNGIQKVHHLN